MAEQEQVSAGTQLKVLHGRAGWLFLDNDSNAVVRQHAGERLFAPGSLDLWRRTLDMRESYCRSRRIAYAKMVAPDTHAIYPEYLPESLVPAPVRPIHQLIEHLQARSGIPLVYPLAELQAAKSRGLVGHQTDSHWSSFGAFVAYRTLMQALGVVLPILVEDDVAFSERTGVGDLGTKLFEQAIGAYTHCSFKRPRARLVWSNGVSNRGNIALWESRDASLPVGLLCSDSYGYHLQPFLAESFSRMIAVHSPLMELELIERYRPDVVINVLAERFILVVPDDLRGEGALELGRRKRPDAATPWSAAVPGNLEWPFSEPGGLPASGSRPASARAP
jgi:acetyltransferase AlgX (SGNH hydrolase-like protein)